MSARSKVLLIVVAAIVAAYPGYAWLIGIEVEAQLGRDEQQLLGNDSSLTLVSRDYRRGVYGATEELTYSFGGSLAQALRALPGRQNLLPLRLTVRNTIHHGPLPRLRAVALASIDSQLILPPRLRQQVDAVIGDQPIVQTHVTLGLLGGAKAALTSPAFHYRIPDGTTLSWGGVTGTIAADRTMQSWSGNFTAPSFDLLGAKGGVKLTDLRLSAQRRRAFDALYLGNSEFKLARLELHPATGTPVVLQGVTLNGTSSADADYVDTGMTMTADTLQSARFSATRVSFAERVTHLHGPSLAALTRALREIQRNAVPGGVALPQSKMLDVFRQFGVELLLHEPVIEITRIGFVMPQGEFNASGRLTMPGLQRAELQGPAAMATLVRHAQATADLRIDNALAQKLLDGSDRREMLSAQIGLLERQGYLKRAGGALTMHLAYGAGKLSINGQPYPPMPTLPTP